MLKKQTFVKQIDNTQINESGATTVPKCRLHTTEKNPGLIYGEEWGGSVRNLTIGGLLRMRTAISLSRNNGTSNSCRKLYR